MTNWMTAAGLALIAGGLATLICFRTVLFGAGRRRAARRATREQDRHEARITREQARQQARAIRAQDRATRDGGGPRRRRGADEPLEVIEMPVVVDLSDEDERPGGLASIGFADEEDEDEDPGTDSDEPTAATEGKPEPRPVPDRSNRHYGHRVDGWVRPEYQEVPAGEYWTPPPNDPPDDHEPSAHGYGWPVQVERLPPVPSYEPSTGFDLKPVTAEPTETMPAWPRRAGEDRRVRLPRSWAARDEKPFAGREEMPFAARDEKPPAGRDEMPLAGRGEVPPAGRDEKRWEAPEFRPDKADRPRPRPRPRPDQRNGVYVSRHAADPPR